MLRRTVLALPSLFLSPTPADRFLSSADASEFIKKETFQLPAEVELLIIGSGAAGLSCAVRAAELGVKSILLAEKEPLIGGSSKMCGGHFSVADTEYQRINHVKDSSELFYRDLIQAGGGKNDPSLVQKFVEAGRAQFDFLYKNNIKPMSLWASGGSDIPRGHVFNPQEIVFFLLDKARNANVRIVPSVRAVGIALNPASQAMTVTLEHLGQRLKVKTAVTVLASGGFANNRKMLQEYLNDLENIQVFSGNGNTGDGHKIGLELGGQLIDTEFIKPSYGFIKNAADPNDFTMIFYGGAVILNQDGHRFVNESISYKDIGLIALQQTNGRSFIVFDENIRLRQLESRPPEAKLWENLNKHSSHVFFADTIAEAARRAGLHPINTEKTIRDYNEMVEQGMELPFGRKSLSGGFGKPVKIERPPFYVMPASSGIMGTYCGLKVNDRTQLLRSNGQIIPNVLAAGEIMGGVHGENFTPGCGFGKALAFGRVAGETAYSLIHP